MKKLIFFVVATLFASVVCMSQTQRYYPYENALISNNTRAVALAADGNVWIGSTQGITRYDGSEWSLYNTDNGLPNNMIYDVYCAGNGDVWIATAAGIAVFDGLGWTGYGIGDGLPSNTIWCITGDANGNIWAGTSNAGFFKFDGEVITVYSTSNGLINNSIKDIYADRSGSIWVGTASGLSMFNGLDFKNFTQSNGLGGNLINSIIQMNNGNMAIATNGGVSFYNYSEWQTITTAQGLPNNSILCLTEDNFGNLFMGCANGLFRYTDEDTYQTFTVSNGLSNNIVNCLTIDALGNIWAGTPFNGLTVGEQNENFTIIRTNLDIVSNEVKHFSNSNGKVLISTAEGLNMVDGFKWRTYTTTEGIVDNAVNCSFTDNDGVIWIGTANGLTRINGTQINNFTNANGLTHNNVVSITQDNNDLVYIATDDKIVVFNGLSIVDTISTDDGIADNKIFQVFFDQDAKLWVLCDGGISFRESDEFIDANVIALFEVVRPMAIANDAAGGVVIGSDEYLYFYPDGLTAASAIAHPFTVEQFAVLSIISEAGGNYLMNFENGALYQFDGTTWDEIPTAFPVSYVYAENNHVVWHGFTDDGAMRICPTCTETSFTVSQLACSGENLIPTVDISITSPTGPGYEYSLDAGLNFSNNSTFTGVKAGTYHLLIRNSGTIVADSVITIEAWYGIETVMTISQINCYGNNNGSVEITQLPVPGSFIWNNNNTTQTLFENLTAAVYSVSITDATSSCKLFLSNQIIEPSQLIVNETVQHVLCHGNTTGSISLSISGGTTPYSIQWNGGSTGTQLNNLTAGNYNYTVTDNNGCQVTAQVNITQPASALSLQGEAADVDCYGDLGWINTEVSGGTLPYDFLWNDDNTNQNQTDIAAGTYHLTVTDANSCIISGSWQVTQPNAPIEISDIDVVNVYCFGESTGSIDITVEGGTPDYEYSWSKNSEFFSNTEDIDELSIGTYHVVVTDSRGCSDATSVVISQSLPLQLSIITTPITCPGYNNGVLHADVSGGTGIYSSFYWYNNQAQVVSVAQTYQNVSPGTYTLLVTDSYYCTISDVAVMTEGEGYNVEMQVSHVSCHGASDGSIQVIVNGGAVTDVDYVWTDGVGGNSPLASNLQAGTYHVTIIDSENCESSASAIVSQPAMADLGAFPENGEYRFCSGDELILDAGEGYNSYAWSTGSTNQSIPVINGGTYTIVVRDVNNCLLGDTATVVVGTVFQDEDINLVSVNEINKVTLYWQKTPDVGTDYYNIYRKSGFQYVLYDNHDALLPAIYIDDNSDATQTNYSYKISSVDTCGNESFLSDAHSSIFLSVNSAQYNQQVVCTLNYTPYEGFFVVYYYILKGTSPDNLEVADQNLYNEYQYIEFNPNAEGTYYQIMVRRLDGCYPGDGNYYDTAYSNIVFCQPYNALQPDSFDAEIQVYPSVFSDHINLEFGYPIHESTNLSLVNTIGQSVFTQTLYVNTEGKQRIEIPRHISPGMYMLQIKTGNRLVNKKLIKE